MMGRIQRIRIEHVETTHGSAALTSIIARAGIAEPGRRIDTDHADSTQASLGRQPHIHASMAAGIREPRLRDRINEKCRLIEESDPHGQIHEPTCRQRGDDGCRFDMSFSERAIT